MDVDLLWLLDHFVFGIFVGGRRVDAQDDFTRLIVIIALKGWNVLELNFTNRILSNAATLDTICGKCDLFLLSLLSVTEDYTLGA